MNTIICGHRRIVAENVVEILAYEEVEPGFDEEMGERIYGQPFTVEVITTATTSSYVIGGDYDGSRVEVEPYTIRLFRTQAKDFLRAWDAMTAGSARQWGSV